MSLEATEWGPMKILFKIGLRHPSTCRKRLVNGTVNQMRPLQSKQYVTAGGDPSLIKNPEHFETLYFLDHGGGSATQISILFDLPVIVHFSKDME
jgi:hypothetical protein